MKKNKVRGQVLSVMATSRTLHGVLLEHGEGDLKVLRTFKRQRSARAGGNQAVTPDASHAEGGEFSLQFGEGAASPDNMFLGSEFGVGNLDLSSAESKDEAAGIASMFWLELAEVLAEVRDAGYEQPVLAFSAGTSDVLQMEVRVPSKTKGKDGAQKKGGTSRSQLIELLGQQHHGGIEEETVTFLPMTPTDDGGQRFLALLPKPNDAVAATVEHLRKTQGRQMPPVRVMDTEVPLYLGLARVALNLKAPVAGETAPTGAPNTLIVRAGSEDTLVLFLHGNTLQQSESLRSLTAYEAPETICSRVLLLQDEYGIGEVQHVLLLSEGHEDDLVQSFEMFFPDARVESLRQYVPQLADEYADEVPSGALVAAVAAGLRLVGDERYRGVFENVTLLPKRLMRRQLTLPVTWHVLVLYILLFCTVLFFMSRFFAMEHKIGQHEQAIHAIHRAPRPPLSAQALQARIDSLQAVHAGYMQALETMEGLLLGSDKWTRAMEKSSFEVASVTGIWIDSWHPRAGGLEIVGNATGRDNVVALAERLQGDIVTLTFSEIRAWPVYTFKMNVPLGNELPEAAEYLRAQVGAEEAPASGTVPVTSASMSEAGQENR